MRYVIERHNGSLTEPVFLILVSLAEETRHGYAVLKDVETLSNHRIRMSTGTLYGALRRMLEDGWIEHSHEVDAPRGRQAYRLTTPGRKVLNGEVDRMKLLARLASSRLSRG